MDRRSMGEHWHHHFGGDRFAMGNYYFTPHDGSDVVKVEYSLDTPATAREAQNHPT